MIGKRTKEVEDIKISTVEHKVQISDKEVSIKLNQVYTGIVDGKRQLLDDVLIQSMVEQIAKVIKNNTSKYNPIPNEIVIGRVNEQQVNEQENKKAKKEEQNFIESYEPRFELEQVALNDSVREKIKTAISAVKYKEKMSNEWGMSEYFAGNRAIILNFYGKAGTGKSMTAEAIAKALNKKVYHINYSDLESKYVGETPKNIRKAFERATKDDAVLIFDEADSFLGKRLTSVTQSADYGVNITRSVLLMELEKFSGVVVFTTNLISNYDEAFKRRILLSVYFELPDEKARAVIWKLHLNNKMPLHNEVTAEVLAGRYNDLSGADIKDMVFYAALYALEKEKSFIDLEVFDNAYKTIRERYENKGNNSKVQVVSMETITNDEYLKEISNE